MFKPLLTAAVAATLCIPTVAQVQLPPGPVPVPCGNYTATIWAGQSIDAGSIEVTNSADNIRVEIDVDSPWMMTEVHIYAGLGSLPTNGGGNVAPGQFPYQRSFAQPGVDHHVANIPLASVGLACDDIAVMAVHVVVEREDPQNPGSYFSETGCVYGPNSFPGNQWGWSFQYEICCEGCGSSQDLNLSVAPLVTGTTVNIQVDNANANEDVTFVYNCGPISCNAGPMPAALGGLALDLLPSVMIAGTATADANGLAVLAVVVPP